MRSMFRRKERLTVVIDPPHGSWTRWTWHIDTRSAEGYAHYADSLDQAIKDASATIDQRRRRAELDRARRKRSIRHKVKI
jgi:hypothetical protein